MAKVFDITPTMIAKWKSEQKIDTDLLAATYQVTKGHISKTICKLKDAELSRIIRKNSIRATVPEEEKEKIIELIKAMELSTKEIAEDTGVSKSTVLNLRHKCYKEFGIPIPKAGGRRKGAGRKFKVNTARIPWYVSAPVPLRLDLQGQTA